MRRTFFAPPLTTTWPSVTCPSPPSATLAPRRTERMVVPWNCSMGSRVGMRLAGDPRPETQEYPDPEQSNRAHDERAGRQVERERYGKSKRIAANAEQV